MHGALDDQQLFFRAAAGIIQLLLHGEGNEIILGSMDKQHGDGCFGNSLDGSGFFERVVMFAFDHKIGQS